MRSGSDFGGGVQPHTWNDNGQAVVAARTWDLYMEDRARLVYLPRGIARRGVAEGNAAQWTSKFASAVLTAFDAGASAA